MMKMRKTVKFLSNKDLDEWAKEHPWKEERIEARNEQRRRSRKRKNKNES
jgi:hypothetical protein